MLKPCLVFDLITTISVQAEHPVSVAHVPVVAGGDPELVRRKVRHHLGGLTSTGHLLRQRENAAHERRER